VITNPVFSGTINTTRVGFWHITCPPVMRYKTFSGFLRVKYRSSSVVQLRMPDKDIALFTDKNFPSQSVFYQFLFYVSGRLRHFVVNGMQTAMREYVRWDFMTTGIIGNRAGFRRLILKTDTRNRHHVFYRWRHVIRIKMERLLASFFEIERIDNHRLAIE
jgi:hypothetical protein